MTNNRELSQLATLIEVLDQSRHINIKSDTNQNIGIGSTVPQRKIDLIGDARVSTDLVVGGSVSVGASVSIGTRLGIASDLRVSGVTTTGFLDVIDNLTVNKQANLTGITSVTNFRVVGVSTFNSLDVGVGATILKIDSDGSVGIGTSLKNVNINSSLNVSGNTTISGILAANSITITSGVDYAASSGISTTSQGLTGTPSISVSGINASGVSTFNAAVDIFGSNQLRFNSSSFNINHDGSNALISNGLGKLILGADNGNSISLERVGIATLARFTHNAGSELYFGGSKKFETISTGSTVTGNLFATHLSSSGVTTTPSLVVSGFTTTASLSVGTSGTSIYTVSGIGSVGIGTITPVSHVEISKRNNVDDTFITGGNPQPFQLLLNNPTTTNGTWSGLSFGVSTLHEKIGAAIVHRRTGTDSIGSLNFYTKSANPGTALSLRMCMDNGVGIGTTNPITDLHVQGNSYFDGVVGFNTTVINGSTQVDFGNSNVYFGGYFNVGLAVTLANVARSTFVGGVSNPGGVGHLLVTSNSVSTPTTIFSANNSGRLSIFAGALTSAGQRGGQIDFVGGGSSVYGGELLFRTGIGTLGTEQPITARLDTAGVMYANTFTSTSDERLKANIETIDDPFVILNEIKGVRFNWKDGGDPSVGVVAQDVEKVLPEAVKTDPEGMKSVCYDMLIGVLIEAIKDQQKRIDDLEARLNDKE